MALQIQRSKSQFVYKISESEPCTILVRRNKANLKWRKYETFSSAQTATDALLRLSGADDARASGLGAEVVE